MGYSLSFNLQSYPITLGYLLSWPLLQREFGDHFSAGINVIKDSLGLTR